MLKLVVRPLVSGIANGIIGSRPHIYRIRSPRVRVDVSPHKESLPGSEVGLRNGYAQKREIKEFGLPLLSAVMLAQASVDSHGFISK